MVQCPNDDRLCAGETAAADRLAEDREDVERPEGPVQHRHEQPAHRVVGEGGSQSGDDTDARPAPQLGARRRRKLQPQQDTRQRDDHPRAQQRQPERDAGKHMHEQRRSARQRQHR
jgi:hypothetical protein